MVHPTCDRRNQAHLRLSGDGSILSTVLQLRFRSPNISFPETMLITPAPGSCRCTRRRLGTPPLSRQDLLCQTIYIPPQSFPVYSTVHNNLYKQHNQHKQQKAHKDFHFAHVFAILVAMIPALSEACNCSRIPALLEVTPGHD